MGVAGSASVVMQCERLVVPEAHDPHRERQRIRLAVNLPAADGGANLLDLLGCDLGDVLDQGRLDVRGELAAAALHIDVRRVTGLKSRVELGEHVLMRHRADLDGDPRVRRAPSRSRRITRWPSQLTTPRSAAFRRTSPQGTQLETLPASAATLPSIESGGRWEHAKPSACGTVELSPLRRGPTSRSPGPPSPGLRHLSSPATRLMVVARITPASRCDSSAWRRAADRKADVLRLVSETWNVMPTVKAT